MQGIENLQSVLTNLVSLLTTGGQTNWALAMQAFLERSKIVEDQSARQILARDILRLYGGMGSFSDLVLVRGDQVLIDESNRLKEEQELLFRCARELS